jgi:hypothetical protein
MGTAAETTAVADRKSRTCRGGISRGRAEWRKVGREEGTMDGVEGRGKEVVKAVKGTGNCVSLSCLFLFENNMRTYIGWSLAIAAVLDRYNVPGQPPTTT